MADSFAHPTQKKLTVLWEKNLVCYKRCFSFKLYLLFSHTLLFNSYQTPKCCGFNLTSDLFVTEDTIIFLPIVYLGCSYRSSSKKWWKETLRAAVWFGTKQKFYPNLISFTIGIYDETASCFIITVFNRNIGTP